MKNGKVLIVEDEQIISLELSHRLKKSGYEILGTPTSGWEAYELAISLQPDIILMDIHLSGDLDGIRTSEAIRAKADIPVIYLTAYIDDRTVARAKVTEPYGYLLKPFEQRELESTIEIALYRKEMEDKLKESQRWLNATLRSIGDSILATDSNGLIKFSNKHAEILLQIDKNSLEGKHIGEVFRLIDYNTHQELANPVVRVLSDPQTSNGYNEVLLKRSNDELIVIEERTTLIRDDRGILTGVVLVFRDISERKLAERQIIDSEAKYRLLFESMSLGVIYNDSNGIIIAGNPMASRVLEVPQDNLSGMSLFNPNWRLYDESGKELPTHNYPASICLRTMKPVENAIIQININDSIDTKWLLCCSIPEFRINESHVYRVFTTFIEITKIKQYEKELFELNCAKDKFFSIIAHDLKSPFQGLIGFTTLLNEEFDTLELDEIKKFIGSIERSTRNVYQLILQLLEWSRIQTGHLDLQKQKLDLRQIVLDTFELVEANAESKNISMHNLLDSSVMIEGDERMINSVVENLLLNAIKFTRPGGFVKLYAFKDEVKVKITVEDSGVGIPKANLDNLFRIDKHVSTTGTKGETGTGLGLILCKEIIEKLGGKIWAESVEGVGSKFHFALPIIQKQKIIT